MQLRVKVGDMDDSTAPVCPLMLSSERLGKNTSAKQKAITG